VKLFEHWIDDRMSSTHTQYIPSVGHSPGCPADSPKAPTPSQTHPNAPSTPHKCWSASIMFVTMPQRIYMLALSFYHAYNTLHIQERAHPSHNRSHSSQLNRMFKPTRMHALSTRASRNCKLLQGRSGEGIHVNSFMRVG